MYRQLTRYFSNRVTMLKGIVTGPEISDSVIKAFKAGDFPVEFETINNLNLNSNECIEKVKRNKYIFAGNVGEIENHTAENLKLFKLLELYGEIIHFKTMPNTNTFYKDIDTIVIRENLEGEYSLIEHEKSPGNYESIKLITEKGSTRISKLAFKIAQDYKRKKITAIHKANIMKLVDGLFLDCSRKVSKNNPDIKYDEMIVDNCTMQIVTNPHQFDVCLAPNLFAGIISSIFSGIIKGPGLESGWYYGDNYHVFSQGLRVLGSKMIGKANPTGALLSSSNLLNQLGLEKESLILKDAVHNVYEEGLYIQKSAGGKSTKNEFLDRVLTEIKDLSSQRK